jgi:PAS domain S-box-containing protein
MQSNRHIRPQRWPTQLPLLAGGIGIGIGTLVMLGGFRPLQDIFPSALAGVPSTHPNIALCAICAGITLCLLAFWPFWWATWIGAGTAGTIVLIAGFTTSEYLFGWDMGIDSMLLPMVPPALRIAFPDRPPPQAAISFLIIGVILLIRAHRPRQSTRYLLLLSIPFLLALLSIFGHLHHVLNVSVLAPLTGMAFPTAALLIVLGSGIIALHPTCSLMRVLTSTGQTGVLARHLLPASVGLPLLIGSVVSLGQRLGYLAAQETLALVGVCSTLAFLVASWWIIATIDRLDAARTTAELTVQQLAAQRKRLLEVAQSLVRTTSADGLLTQVQQGIGAILAYDGFGLYWLDPKAQVLQPALFVQTAQGLADLEAVALPLDRGIAGHVVRTGQGELLNDAQNDPRAFYPAGMVVAREHLICLPLRTTTETLGVFLISRHAESPFTTDEFELVQLFIGYATLAISNARLFAQATDAADHYRTLLVGAERQAQELALIGQVRNALARELDLDVMFRTVVEAISTSFGYTHVSLYLLENTMLSLQYQVGYAQVIASVPISSGISGRVVRTGQAVLLEDVQHDPAFLGAIPGIVSEVCVPLFDHGAVVGTLNIETTQGIRLTTADLQLMQVLGEHIGIAVGRARLYTAVRTSESRFATIFRASPVAICITTLAEKVYLDVNAQFLSLTGYTRAELIGQRADDQNMWAGPDEQIQMVHTLQKHGSIQSMEIGLRTQTGTVRDVLCSIELIEVDGAACLLSMMQDLTEHKQAAAEREHLIRELRGALANIRTLRGLLPICASCKKIRDDSGYWSQLETYFQVHADVAFSHGICPECLQRLYPDLAAESEPNSAKKPV